MEHPELVESPRKRQKTEADTATDGAAEVQPETNVLAQNSQVLKELEVGITEFVTPENEGFSGILKKRYTDFLVNEILPSGEVLHLRNITAPNSSKQQDKAPAEPEPSTEKKTEEPAKEEPPAEFSVSEEDNVLLGEYLGNDNAATVIALHKRAMSNPKLRPADIGQVTVSVSDRDVRTKIHQTIRRVFRSQLESSTDSEGNLAITAANNRFNRKPQGRAARGGRAADGGRMSWDELGGPYLHFTIYKENKDTMEVISFLARSLKMNPKGFQFAGTKDRRGATAQRACILRAHADRLASMNKGLRNAVLGDFEYRKHGLELGDLNGNEFVITLRDSEIPGVDLKDPQAAIAKTNELVGTALKNVCERGYFNYYGLQRFGSFSTRTDTIGVKILQDDFKGAVDSILYFAPHVLAAAKDGEASTALISSDDKARAEAIDIFHTTGKINDALAKLPRKFSAEASLIRHLGKAKSDYLGALQTIPRNLRLMYVHAYQSLVWNYAASQRWRLYGDKVVEGDLVIVQEHRDKEANAVAEPAGDIDADGEVIIKPQGEDSAAAAEDMFTRARALTAEEVAGGKYSIFDVVLPQPGFDVIYPANKMTDFYREFMGSEKGGGLDPFNMRRKWKDASLSGGYRKLLSRMGADYSVDTRIYTEDNEQFVKTDLEKLKEDSASDNAPNLEGDKLAIILKFQLGSSQYATMALRELTKGKIQEYKPDFGGGR
ncbi:hypothetical protein N7532_007043 [Penicillium argentinense]|uniref:TRUD domain-containing protein n=1 Tax=Penicillium argentinense TaxID=1131581 RepID=A0A9W9FHG2_9EURO|nr:uncharacterized protein N7532_007043 [Penicillium argentinense]KAJ5100042.1 hypothetical protein N7532_007043 [Penicillium argentinense]